MCLILVAHACCPDYRLVVAANRDEYHQRPAAPLGYWDDRPHILAGRDLEGSGTWLGITTRGRFAAVTNVRAGHAPRRGPRSRGLLVSDFLSDPRPVEAFCAELAERARDYDGFNLLAHDGQALAWYSNQAGQAPRTLAPGLYTVSNAALDTPWPKTARLRAAFAEVMAGAPADPGTALLEVLRDARPAPETELPDTGMARDLERALSAIFIEGETYGTRASTVLLVDAHGRVEVRERRYDARAAVIGDSRQTFELLA
jgi:uncharacterized protein with NRDE domain